MPIKIMPINRCMMTVRANREKILSNDLLTSNKSPDVAKLVSEETELHEILCKTEGEGLTHEQFMKYFRILKSLAEILANILKKNKDNKAQEQELKFNKISSQLELFENAGDIFSVTSGILFYMIIIPVIGIIGAGAAAFPPALIICSIIALSCLALSLISFICSQISYCIANKYEEKESDFLAIQRAEEKNITDCKNYISAIDTLLSHFDGPSESTGIPTPHLAPTHPSTIGLFSSPPPSVSLATVNPEPRIALHANRNGCFP